MKRLSKPVLFSLVGAGLAGPAAATVLTFNNLPTFADPGSPTGITGGYFDSLPGSTYQGFSFANANGSRWFWNPNPDTTGGPYNGVGPSTWLGVAPPSPVASGVNANLAPAITSATDFVFDGASFAGYDPIRYMLYLDGALKYTSASCNVGFTQQFCASGYSGLVDQVVIENQTAAGTDAGIYFAMDNFTYSSAPAVTVPEPTTLALVAGALALATRLRKTVR